MMNLDEGDVSQILEASKTISGDVEWEQSDTHAAWVKFQAAIETEAGFPLRLVGNYSPFSRKLSFALIHTAEGRIYGLDLGQKHHNPTCDDVGETHKHRWTDEFGDKNAYEPSDITADFDEVELAWEEFCAEANIHHDGDLDPPPALQDEIL